MATATSARIVIDRRLCKACGLCVGMCPKKVFTRDADGRPVTEQLGECIACGNCELICPDFAIRIVEGA
jgi:2-oxoglutarate ferredoxin oxidoreductase subunit delta